MAELLGYKCHAELSLSSKMAPNVGKVMELVDMTLRQHTLEHGIHTEKFYEKCSWGDRAFAGRAVVVAVVVVVVAAAVVVVIIKLTLV